MAAAMQATAEALGNQINQGNHGNTNDEDGPMTLATFLKVHPPTFRGTSNPTYADNWIQVMERALQAQQLWKYTPDASHVLEPEPIQVREDLTLPVIPVRIDDFSIKRLRGREVSLVKVAWSRAGIEEHTWELESDI
ncbi:uncharacterized protein [Arachis hypogaea]|uniref:uncharacterized protein n=1 Tax=Arachis hypogaea TaxID=3818 RepID=UPI003B219247